MLPTAPSMRQHINSLVLRDICNFDISPALSNCFNTKIKRFSFRSLHAFFVRNKSSFPFVLHHVFGENRAIDCRSGETGAGGNPLVLIRTNRSEIQLVDLVCVLFCLQSPNGVVSAQLYAELFAAYLYKNDL